MSTGPPSPLRWKSQPASSWNPLDTVHRRAKKFTEDILSAAKEHVGKTKPGKHRNAGISATVRALVKKRNFFRRRINTHRQEWVTACGEVTEAVSAEKEKRWTEFVDTLESSKDYKKTWGILGSINGKPDSCCPNEAIRHNGKILVSNESKADTFAAHYAKVSKLEFSREKREKNRLAKIRDNAPSVEDSSTAEFRIEELNRAIKKMRKNGAAGPDDIPQLPESLGTSSEGGVAGDLQPVAPRVGSAAGLPECDHHSFAEGRETSGLDRVVPSRQPHLLHREDHGTDGSHSSVPSGGGQGHLQPFAGRLQEKQKLRRPAPADDPGRQRRLPREETDTDRHGSPGTFPGLR